MICRAPRRPLRLRAAWVRGAGLAGCLWLAGQAGLACEARYPERGLPGRAAETGFSNRTAQDRHEHWAPRDASLRMFAAYASETSEYGHGVLGRLKDAKVLTIHVSRPGDSRITCPAEAVLPDGQVFEDIAPNLADVDGDGLPEVIAVRSSVTEGARLEVYSRRAELLAATPAIGTRNRWLAPVGAADLDGDGHVEIAYIDRPHLAKTLRIWRFREGELTEIASKAGLTNHRIGEEFITSGIRDCGQGPELVTVSGNWQRVIASRLAGGEITSRDIGPFLPETGLQGALACR